MSTGRAWWDGGWETGAISMQLSGRQVPGDVTGAHMARLPSQSRAAAPWPWATHILHEKPAP